MTEMRRGSRSAGVMTVLVVIGVIAAVSAAIAGFVLTKIYVSPLEGFGAAPHMAQKARSVRWGHWHRLATGVFLVASVGAFGAGVVQMWRSVSRWRGLALAGSAVAALLAVVTLATERLVEWDQLALYDLTNRLPGSGYWTAAFGQNVRFIISNNTQVSQGEYRMVLFAHLASPAVGIVALAGVGVALAKSKPAGIDAPNSVSPEWTAVDEPADSDSGFGPDVSR